MFLKHSVGLKSEEKRLRVRVDLSVDDNERVKKKIDIGIIVLIV